MLTARSIKPGAEVCSDECNPFIVKQARGNLHPKVSVRTGSTLAIAMRDLRIKNRSKRKTESMRGSSAPKTRKTNRKKRNGRARQKTRVKHKHKIRAKSSTLKDTWTIRRSTKKLRRRSMSLNSGVNPLVKTATTSQSYQKVAIKADSKLNFFMSSTGVTQIKVRRASQKRPVTSDTNGKKPSIPQTKKPRKSQSAKTSWTTDSQKNIQLNSQKNIQLKTVEGKKNIKPSITDSSQSKQSHNSNVKILDGRQTRQSNVGEREERRDVPEPTISPQTTLSSPTPELKYRTRSAIITPNRPRQDIVQRTKPKSSDTTLKISATRRKSKSLRLESKSARDWLEKLSREDLLKLLCENDVREVEVNGRVYRIQTSRGRNGPSLKHLQVWALDWWKKKNEEASIARGRWLKILEDKAVDPCLSSREYVQVQQKIREFKGVESPGKKAEVLKPPQWVLDALTKEE